MNTWLPHETEQKSSDLYTSSLTKIMHHLRENVYNCEKKKFLNVALVYEQNNRLYDYYEIEVFSVQTKVMHGSDKIEMDQP